MGMNTEIDDDIVVVTIYCGKVEYSQSRAAVDIEELIGQLMDLRADGATHVVGLSGNYRGTQYVKLGKPKWKDD